MANEVRAAMVQTAWTGDKESMINLHEKHMREAAAAGARVMCFQELFYGPYFCQVQEARYYDYAEAVPDGPTTKRFQELAAELGMVLVLPVYEKEQEGLLYNTAAVIDADGTYLGKYRKTHIPQLKGFLEKFYFRPGNLGYPVFDTAVGRIGVYICYDRHFPEYLRALALAGAEVIFVPQAGAVGEWPDGLYEAEMQVAAFQNGVFTALCNRVGEEEQLTFAGESFVCDPGGRVVARAQTGRAEVLHSQLDLAQVGASHGQRLFMRDRRPELYGPWL